MVLARTEIESWSMLNSFGHAPFLFLPQPTRYYHRRLLRGYEGCVPSNTHDVGLRVQAALHNDCDLLPPSKLTSFSIQLQHDSGALLSSTGLNNQLYMLLIVLLRFAGIIPLFIKFNESMQI